MNKKDWEEIVKLNWIKSLDKELISEIKESTSIKRFKAGTILSNKENIQSEVFFILEGNARITFNYKNDFYTIEKLKKDDWIGLISYLFSMTLIITGINILRTKEFFLLIENLFFATIYAIFGSLFFGYFYSNDFILYINGNGGFIGSYLNKTFLNTIILSNEIIFYYVLIILTIIYIYGTL